MTDQQLHFTDIAGMLAELRVDRSIVLTVHTTPDGDALGSQLALLRFLRAEGRTVTAVNCDPVPETLRFLDPHGDLQTWDPSRHATLLRDAGLVVCLDFNERSRVRSMSPALESTRARIAVIDHHLDPRPFAHLYLNLTEASSSAEIVFDLIAEAGVALTKDLALPLYVGMVTDTGSFRFDKTTPAVHRKAAAMLEAGVDPSDTHRRVYDDYPINRTMLLGHILSGMRVECEGRVTLLTVTKAMFDMTGTTAEHVENTVNYGLSIRGVEAAALLTELDDAVKISFRSSGRIAVNDIAHGFNGGGHRLAAGGRVQGEDIASVRERVAAALCKALNE